MKTQCVYVCAVLLFLASVAAGSDDDKLKETARAVLAKHQDAVVCVRIAGYSYFENDGKKERKGDFKLETSGTVLTPDGITAVSRFDSLPGSDPPALAGDIVMTPKFEFTSAKLILKNGRDIPADIVFRDDKFGIVYFAPKAKDLKLACIRFEKTKDPERLDRLISLSRLDGKFDFEAEINLGRVTAVVKKPRRLIVTDGGQNGANLLGALFNAAGHPIGIGGACRGEIQSVYGPDERPVLVDADALESGIREATKGWEKKAKED